MRWSVVLLGLFVLACGSDDDSQWGSFGPPKDSTSGNDAISETGSPPGTDASSDADGVTAWTCLGETFCVDEGDCQQGERCNQTLTAPQCQQLYCASEGEPCDPGHGDSLCAPGLVCLPAFIPSCVVECTADCGGRVCGSDGCGGSCGTCEAGQACVDGACAGGQVFEGLVYDFQTRSPVVGATVTVLDPESGQAIGQTMTADGNGAVSAVIEAGLERFNLLVEADGQRDTYDVGFDFDGANVVIWSVSEGTYVAAPALAGIALDESKALAFGGVFYTNASGEEEAVGCSVVEVVGEDAGFMTDNVRYMNEAGLPTTLDVQAWVNPTVPYYIAGNLPVVGGVKTLRALVDGETVGEIEIPSVPGAVTVADIYTSDGITANPMPATCQ